MRSYWTLCHSHKGGRSLGTSPLDQRRAQASRTLPAYLPTYLHTHKHTHALGPWWLARGGAVVQFNYFFDFMRVESLKPVPSCPRRMSSGFCDGGGPGAGGPVTTSVRLHTIVQSTGRDTDGPWAALGWPESEGHNCPHSSPPHWWTSPTFTPP